MTMEWGASAVGGTRSADHLTSATPEDSTLSRGGTREGR